MRINAIVGLTQNFKIYIMDINKTLDLLYRIEDYLEYDQTELGLEVGLFINELQKQSSNKKINKI